MEVLRDSCALLLQGPRLVGIDKNVSFYPEMGVD